jgi:K+-transporting ATPase ATPase A chain
MPTSDWIQLALFFATLVALVKPLGGYMARVYSGVVPAWLGGLIGPVERLIYRLCGVRSHDESDWKRYAGGLLVFNLLGVLFVYGVQRLQHVLPANPAARPTVSPALAFNTAVSFATNTNWQAYGGESTMSYLTQMLALTVQNFVSAATGMAVLVALIRGLARQSTSAIGSFWVDLTRSTLYILLPFSLVLAVALVSQGVVQTFAPYHTARSVQRGTPVVEQTIAVGPVASQVAIKQLGTNGGGFFGANSAHPFENPTPLSNFLEMLAILLIPAALCYTFGCMVGNTRQGWAVLAAMLAIFVPLAVACVVAERGPNPALAKVECDWQAQGNMEGKEVRFGAVNSALWATATTAASNGSVNSMHDSFTPLGGLIPMWLIQLGEVIFGGVGSGLYGMLVFVIIAVFVAGLMVGRTPEYLGKKIEAFEIKMASLVILIPPAIVLVGTAVACVSGGGRFNPDGSARLNNPGPHGFSQILYAMSSAGNNNGSAFAGLSADNVFYDVTTGVLMLLARYWLIVPTLAIAGSLARKKRVPAGAGTLATDSPLFVGLLVAVVVLVGALTFIPALALGPVIEHLMR